jgi:hypothetical protein
MRYIYREEHRVFVDYEITLTDEELVDKGISPYDDLEISEYIKQNFLEIQPESTEWWISAQEQDFVVKVGIRESDDNSESTIKWI